MASQTTTRIEPQKLEDLLKFRRELSHNFMPATAKEDEVFDSDKVFDFIYTKTSKLMDTSHLFIIFGNKVTSTHKLQIFNQSSKVKEKFNHHEELYSSFKEDKTKIRKLFASEKELYLETKSEVARFFALEPGEKEIFPTTLLCIKMLWKEMPIGMFIIYHPTQEHAYDENRLNLLQELSNQVATYLYNRRLVQQRTALLEISKELTSTAQLKEDTILGLVYKQTRQLMHSHNMLVVLRNKQTGYLRLVLAYRNGDEVSVVEEEQNQFYQSAKTVIANEVIQKRKPVFIRTKKRIETKFCFGKTHLENLPTTWLAVPMCLGENEQPAMGAFVVYHPRLENAYGESDKDILKAMADRVAVALDHVYFNQKWEKLAEMGHAFAQHIHLNESEILELIRTETENLIGDASHLSIALRVGGQIQLVFEEGKFINEDAYSRYQRYLNRPCRTLIDKIFNEKNSILLETRSKITANLVEPENKKVPASWLGVPMHLGKDVIGAFVISHPELEYAYDKTDEMALSVLSDRAAIILDNARLSQRQKALAEIGQELTESIKVTESDIVSIIYERAKPLMDVSNMYIILQDDITGAHRFALAYKDDKAIEADVAQSESAYKLAQHKIQEVLRGKGNPVLLTTKEQVKKAFAKPQITESDDLENVPATWLGVPIRLRSDTMGLFVVYHPTQEHVYNESDGDLLGAMSDYAAVAINNQRLLQRREKLLEIQRLTTELRLSEETVVNLIYEQVGHLIDNSNMSIVLKDKVTGKFRLALAYKDSKLESKYGLLPKDSVRYNITEEVFLKKEPVKKQLVRDTNIWWLGVPMRLKKEIIGTFILHRSTSEYEDDIAKILDAMSDQAAVAVDNARMYSLIVEKFKNQNRNLGDQNRKLNALIQVAQELTSSIELPEQQILHVIHTQANKVMDTKNMYAALYDEQNDKVRFPLYFENNFPQKIPPRKMGRGKTEEIIRTKKPIFHPTSAESEEWYAQPGRTNYVANPLPSWIGVPMMYGDKVLGVIAVYHPTQEHIYGEDDLEILGALARLAAIALENSRLYTESKQQAKALEDANRLLEKANQSLAQHQDITTRALIANDFVHRITNLVGTVPGWADMIKGETGQTEPRMEKIAHWADKIRKDIGNLQQSVDKLKEPEHEIQIDIVFIITNMLRQVRIQFRNKISAGQLEIKENIHSTYKVFGLRSALSHAIHGIISNGIEAILETQQQAGILEITTSDYNNSDGEWVKIEVKDTGIGIAKEDFEKIFIPFASTKGRGRGYGLWRSKTVIEDMDGNIEVNSSEGKETVFTILLPKSTKVLDNDY